VSGEGFVIQALKACHVAIGVGVRLKVGNKLLRPKSPLSVFNVAQHLLGNGGFSGVGSTRRACLIAKGTAAYAFATITVGAGKATIHRDFVDLTAKLCLQGLVITTVG
jgi:hypothetical protein